MLDVRGAADRFRRIEIKVLEGKRISNKEQRFLVRVVKEQFALLAKAMGQK